MKINKFFEKGFYINLDRRYDRREQFENEMSNYGLDNFFERISAEDSINESDFVKKHYYCALTYYKLFQRIYDEKYEKILIFEDDAYFYNCKNYRGIELVETALDELEYFSDWQMIYFGGHPIREVDVVSKTLMRAPTILATHAVGYKRNVIKIILDNYKVFQDSAIDGWLGQRHDIIKYIIYPIAVPQRISKSDLDASGDGVGINGFKDSYRVVKKNYMIYDKKIKNINK